MYTLIIWFLILRIIVQLLHIGFYIVCLRLAYINLLIWIIIEIILDLFITFGLFFICLLIVFLFSLIVLCLVLIIILVFRIALLNEISCFIVIYFEYFTIQFLFNFNIRLFLSDFFLITNFLGFFKISF